ncbi:MAG: hypothetical protein ACRETT_07015 [Steroidobacteraceae bacterium]
MKDKGRGDRDGMRPEYRFDYSTAVRGKYYRRLVEEGSNVVLLDPDVAKAFRTSAAVNEALRGLLKLSGDTQRLTAPRRSRRRDKAARAKRQ